MKVELLVELVLVPEYFFRQVLALLLSICGPSLFQSRFPADWVTGFTDAQMSDSQ